MVEQLSHAERLRKIRSFHPLVNFKGGDKNPQSGYNMLFYEIEEKIFLGFLIFELSK